MPRLSRWFIRASLLYLLAGFTLGSLLLADKGVGIAPYLWKLLPTHQEFLLFGWIVQIAMGVAFWILPRFARGPARGNVVAAWCAFALLNAGTLAAGLGAAAGAAWLLVIGRGAEVGAAMAFTLHAWPRVKPSDLAAGDLPRRSN